MPSGTPDFVARDHALESAQGKATEELAEHRWHWTLDESNLDRISIREYARRVSRRETTIRNMVNGFDAWRGARGAARIGGPESLFDYIEQAKLGIERQEATEVVATVTGKGFGATARHQRQEVDAVLATARDRAERKGTTVSEEIHGVAEWRERSRRAHANVREERKRSAFRLVEFEGHIGYAVRRLRAALDMASEMEFSDEEIEMVEGTLTTLRNLVRLIDLRITGTTGVDWDEELARLTEEAS